MKTGVWDSRFEIEGLVFWVKDLGSGIWGLGHREKIYIEWKSCQLALAGLCEVQYFHRRGTVNGSLFRNLLNTIK